MRVYIAVEGQSEEAVVKGVLVPRLSAIGVYPYPIIVRTSPCHRGGGSHWAKWENDIRGILRQHKGPDVRVTTLFDLFRLPRGFPGLEEHRADPDTGAAMPCRPPWRRPSTDWRFIPYLQRHELEALALASIDSLPDLFDAPEDLRGLRDLAAEIGDQPPEDVDDRPETAPSKRLKRNVPGYRKALHGPMAIEDAGLQAVRARCPRFHLWVETLERIAREEQA